MARLQWNQEVVKKFASGLDRGVLYPTTGSGVPWNGLISVNEAIEGGDTSPLYFDGVKYADRVFNSNYGISLSAYTTPPEFEACVGNVAVRAGFFLTRQLRTPFNLSYRTLLGESDYKIHLLYNAKATLSSRSHTTTTDGSSLDTITVKISAVPVSVPGFKPSAHYVVDSTKISASSLAAFEAKLYGDSSRDAIFPLVSDLVQLSKT